MKVGEGKGWLQVYKEIMAPKEVLKESTVVRRTKNWDILIELKAGAKGCEIAHKLTLSLRSPDISGIHTMTCAYQCRIYPASIGLCIQATSVIMMNSSLLTDHFLLILLTYWINQILQLLFYVTSIRII